MRYIHPAAWIVVAINFLLLFSLYASLGAIDLELLDPNIKLLALYYLELKPLFISLALLQALALWMIAIQVPYARVVAVVGSIFFFPQCLIYLIGCSLSYARIKYKSFTTLKPEIESAEYLFPAGLANPMFTFSLICMVASFVGFALRLLDIGALFFTLVFCAQFLRKRSSQNPALSIHPTYFTISPSVFAGSLLIPFSSVNLATLQDDGNISFEVATSAGPAKLLWPVKTVAKDVRGKAVEKLGETLTKHRITIEQL